MQKSKEITNCFDETHLLSRLYSLLNLFFCPIVVFLFVCFNVCSQNSLVDYPDKIKVNKVFVL